MFRQFDLSYQHFASDDLFCSELCKGIFHPVTCRKMSKYISTLSLTSNLDKNGWSKPNPSRFTLGKEIFYPFHKRFLGSRTGLEGREKFRPQRSSIPRNV
jgi:hypothetical protein